jgi:hypothetical protein
MSDNVMYDSPTEFLHEVATSTGRCVAQSVIPLDEGGYICACSCEQWEIIAPTRQEGLHLARVHTGSIPA